jgi:photosystem II stability/assembly factor-like uncharacterized protein
VGKLRFSGIIALGILISGAGIRPTSSQQWSATGNNSTGNNSSSNFQVPDDPIHKVWREDATIRSIAAISEDRLAAVGDRGLILVSDDAGRTWQTIPSPTSVNLYDVQFNGQMGWIVGGWIGKHTGSSYCVVLQTLDGGNQWQLLSTEGLPRLTGLQLQGSRLICWGDYSPQFGSSIFESLDGGLSWRSALTGITHASAAAVSSEGRVLAVDRLGRAAITGGAVHAITAAEIPVKSVGSTRLGWIAAGDQGQLMLSSDGRTWSNASLPISDNVQRLCCWNSIAQYQDHLWVVGSPGSVVLHSADGGSSWSAFPTGQTLPLNRICFIDPNRGWAVGAQGTLLATRDGGKTWYPQRKQPSRVSLLGLVSHSGAIPWPALAATVWDHKRCATLSALKQAEPITRTDFKSNHQDLSAQVATQIGLSDYEVCHLSELDREFAAAKVAMQLLTWRPDVILSAMDSVDPLAESHVPDVIGKAVQMSSSPVFENELQSLFLPRWQIQKWVAAVDPQREQFSDQGQRVLRESGLSIWDILLALPDNDRWQNQTVSMRTLWTRSQNRTSQTELMGGIASYPESGLRGNIAGLGNYQLVMGRVHRERMMVELSRPDRDSASEETWSKELLFFAQSLPIREFSESLIQLSELLFENRQWKRGQLVLDRLARTSSASADARRWARMRRLQLHGSQEWHSWLSLDGPHLPSDGSSLDLASLAQLESTSPVKAASHLEPWSHSPFGLSEMEQVKPLSADISLTSSVVTASANIPADQPAIAAAQPVSAVSTEISQQVRSGAQQWLSVAESVFAEDASLRFHPNVMMQLASNLRISGQNPLAVGVYQELLRQPQLVAWFQGAKQELAILEGRADQLKWSIRAERAEVPPLLDGVFDEPIWQRTGPMQLTSIAESTEEPAVIRWAYDQDYLYLAVKCLNASIDGSNQPPSQRYYDADLTELDHVELTIDTDRDYSTALEIAVAENGLTYERCAGFAAYNPKWYVHVTPSAGQWRAEIAIPLSQLTRQGVQKGSVWSISARRRRPDGPPQSWSQMRTHRRMLESNGSLIFN